MNNSLIYLAFLLTTLFTSFYSQGQTFLNEKQVIFDSNSGNYRLDSLHGERFRFNPTRSDIVKADSLLEQYLFINHSSAGKPDNYYRQYVGVMKDGLEVIIVWLYCEKPNGFQEQISLIKGGGECYARADVNPKGSKVLSFRFNAPK